LAVKTLAISAEVEPFSATTSASISRAWTLPRSRTAQSLMMRAPRPETNQRSNTWLPVETTKITVRVLVLAGSASTWPPNIGA